MRTLRMRTYGVLMLLLLSVLAPPLAGLVRAEDQPPQLPAYFTATNADAQKPTWPDPTGAASGVWATPAGDARGDVPSSLSTTDVYDRMLHNLYSINYVWLLGAGFLV